VFVYCIKTSACIERRRIAEYTFVEEDLFMSSPESKTATPTVRDRVQTVIAWMRPVIQSDGGDIELLDVTPEGVASIRFHGACVGCPSSTNTLKSGIERNIREKVPEITRVEAVNG
jgi:Fe-S cluster biogenesis protein NfuA